MVVPGQRCFFSSAGGWGIPVGGEGPAGLSWLSRLHVGELEGTKGAFVLLIQKRLPAFIQVHVNIRKNILFLWLFLM